MPARWGVSPGRRGVAGFGTAWEPGARGTIPACETGRRAASSHRLSARGGSRRSRDRPWHPPCSRFHRRCISSLDLPQRVRSGRPARLERLQPPDPAGGRSRGRRKRWIDHKRERRAATGAGAVRPGAPRPLECPGPSPCPIPSPLPKRRRCSMRPPSARRARKRRRRCCGIAVANSPPAWSRRRAPRSTSRPISSRRRPACPTAKSRRFVRSAGNGPSASSKRSRSR